MKVSSEHLFIYPTISGFNRCLGRVFSCASCDCYNLVQVWNKMKYKIWTESFSLREANHAVRYCHMLWKDRHAYFSLAMIKCCSFIFPKPRWSDKILKEQDDTWFQFNPLKHWPDSNLIFKFIPIYKSSYFSTFYLMYLIGFIYCWKI